MKERIIFLNQSELTRTTQPYKLIVMEPNSEGEQGPLEGDLKGVSRGFESKIKEEKIGKGRSESQSEMDRNRAMLERMWSGFYGKSLDELDYDERKGVEAAIAVGAPPRIAGAQEFGESRVGIGEIQDDELREIIQKLETASEVDLGTLSQRLRSRMISSDVSEEDKNRVSALIAEAKSEDVERKKNRQRPETFFGPEELRAIEENPGERDRIFNEIFTRADVNPSQPFNEVFSSFYDQPVYTAFIDHLRQRALEAKRNGDQSRFEELNSAANQYVEEKDVRQSLHDANYVVLVGAGLENLSRVISGFRSAHADLAFAKKGAAAATRLYERALIAAREENGGFLLPEDVMGNPATGEVGKVEQYARKYLDESLKIGAIRQLNKKTGKYEVVEQMDDWEKDRAFSIARGMGIITGRTIEIAAESIEPPEGSIISLYAQELIREISPFRHLVGKFGIAGAKHILFAFHLERDPKKPWTYEELKKFQEEGASLRLNVVNGLVRDEEGGDRYLSQLSPFGVGSMYSISTWRISSDPHTGILGPMSIRGEEDRAGRGILIEKLKADMRDEKKGGEARKKVETHLDMIKEYLPLRIFYQMRDLQEDVVTQLLNETYSKLQTPGEKTYMDSVANLKAEGSIRDKEIKKIKYYGVFVEDVNTLAVLQEKAIAEKSNRLEIEKWMSGQPVDKVERVKRLAETIKHKFDNGVDPEGRKYKDGLLYDMVHRPWRTPFVFGTDDAAYDEFKYANIGSAGIIRRWNDIGSAAKANQGMIKLMNGLERFKKPEDVVEVLHEVHSAVDSYNPHAAEAAVKWLAEGVAKFYSKDYYSRLPLGMGTLKGIASGKNSFAEFAFGRRGTSWDEVAVNHFTHLLRQNYLLKENELKELQDVTIGGKIDVAKAWVRTIVPLMLLAAIAYITISAAKETV